MTREDPLAPLVKTLADGIRKELEGSFRGGIQPRVFDIDGASVYLSRSPDAIRHLVKTGKLRVVRIDGRVQFDRFDLDRLIEESKTA